MTRNTLDQNSLKKVHHHGLVTIAQCPACFAADQDHAGNHLIIFASGKFTCVVNPGPAGHSHRQEIFRLVGSKSQRDPKPYHSPITWKLKPSHNPQTL